MTRGRNFHHLLIAALDGAVAFVEVQDVAMLIGEHLDFDMAGAAYEAFQENGIIAEGCRGLLPGLFHPRQQVFRRIDHAHATAASAERRLDHQRVADLLRDGLRRLVVADGLVGAGNYGNAGLDGKVASSRLVAEKTRGARRWVQ